jgi:hypothetical protein
MDRDREKQAIEAKLARCRELAREFPDGPTAAMIRDLENELRDQVRALETSFGKPPQPRVGPPVGERAAGHPLGTVLKPKRRTDVDGGTAKLAFACHHANRDKNA